MANLSSTDLGKIKQLYDDEIKRQQGAGFDRPNASPIYNGRVFFQTPEGGWMSWAYDQAKGIDATKYNGQEAQFHDAQGVFQRNQTIDYQQSNTFADVAKLAAIMGAAYLGGTALAGMGGGASTSVMTALPGGAGMDVAGFEGLTAAEVGGGTAMGAGGAGGAAGAAAGAGGATPGTLLGNLFGKAGTSVLTGLASGVATSLLAPKPGVPGGAPQITEPTPMPDLLQTEDQQLHKTLQELAQRRGRASTIMTAPASSGGKLGG